VTTQGAHRRNSPGNVRLNVHTLDGRTWTWENRMSKTITAEAPAIAWPASRRENGFVDYLSFYNDCGERPLK